MNITVESQAFQTMKNYNKNGWYISRDNTLLFKNGDVYLRISGDCTVICNSGISNLCEKYVPCVITDIKVKMGV